MAITKFTSRLKEFIVSNNELTIKDDIRSDFRQLKLSLHQETPHHFCIPRLDVKSYFARKNASYPVLLQAIDLLILMRSGRVYRYGDPEKGLYRMEFPSSVINLIDDLALLDDRRLFTIKDGNINEVSTYPTSIIQSINNTRLILTCNGSIYRYLRESESFFKLASSEPILQTGHTTFFNIYLTSQGHLQFYNLFDMSSRAIPLILIPPDNSVIIDFGYDIKEDELFVLTSTQSLYSYQHSDESWVLLKPKKPVIGFMTMEQQVYFCH